MDGVGAQGIQLMLPVLSLPYQSYKTVDGFLPSHRIKFLSTDTHRLAGTLKGKRREGKLPTSFVYM